MLSTDGGRIVYLALRHPRKSGGNNAGLASKSLDVLSSSLFAVGVTSAMFHGTLRQGPQFCDDLSMLALAAALLQPLYTHGRSPAAARLVTGVIILATSTASAIYVQSGKILYHVYIFSAMLTFIWPRTLHLLYRAPGPKGSGRSREERRRLGGRFWKAVALLITAYIIWNIDLEMCLQLRDLRSRIGLPWAWLLEFHGWWHILTALGASEYMQLVRELC